MVVSLKMGAGGGQMSHNFHAAIIKWFRSAATYVHKRRLRDVDHVEGLEKNIGHDIVGLDLRSQ